MHSLFSLGPDKLRTFPPHTAQRRRTACHLCWSALLTEHIRGKRPGLQATTLPVGTLKMSAATKMGARGAEGATQ